jgi:hypothetical protein
MSDSANEIDLDEIVADSITKDAVSDFPRMIFLESRLEAALKDFKTQGDGGLEGALNSVKAYLDYFADRRPEWAKKGLLNPLNAVLETLQALKFEGSSRILFCNDHNINHQLVKTNRNEQFYRSVVCALIDEVKCRSGSSLDEACRRVAARLRFRHFPVGRNDSEDITTLKNWRKQASTGRAKGTIGGAQYAEAKIKLAKIDDSPESIIDAMLETLSGIFPPGDRKLK